MKTEDSNIQEKKPKVNSTTDLDMDYDITDLNALATTQTAFTNVNHIAQHQTTQNTRINTQSQQFLNTADQDTVSKTQLNHRNIGTAQKQMAHNEYKYSIDDKRPQFVVIMEKNNINEISTGQILKKNIKSVTELKKHRKTE